VCEGVSSAKNGVASGGGNKAKKRGGASLTPRSLGLGLTGAGEIDLSRRGKKAHRFLKEKKKRGEKGGFRRRSESTDSHTQVPLLTPEHERRGAII